MSKQHKTSIGGQALIEGIMMKGPEKSAMAIRLPDKSIDVEVWENKTVTAWYRKTPFVRGIFNFVATLMDGYKCLMKSAEKSGYDEENPDKLDLWIQKHFGEKAGTVIMFIASVIGAALALLLFMVIPTFVVNWLNSLLPLGGLATLVEGIIKVAILVGYMVAVSKTPDIHRMFQYHGAEHKSIYCYEAGLPLTVENVRKQGRLHPRCGTSFLLIVVIISVLVNSFISWSNPWLRVVFKLLLLPVVVGISYEIIKLAGRYTNLCTRAISAPGMWLQKITTQEPDDEMIEIALAALMPVLPEVEGSDNW
ncbi:MAG: DUF1385 domain-containing protein [Oscillospiraceae bacterium]|nr:DUF1385 domain-containing protein [Oscillospiraceae bacterium]MBQ3242874.1 DUF1385 domain-containing protein [Oscillospiraceae bacterium]MBR2635696.1 DUF1385 domain-containing protein [Oscillospiraceae bacterium]